LRRKDLPMKKTFAKSLSGYSAAQISEAVGCKKATAYDWLGGRRKPPKWQQPDILERLRGTVSG